MPCWYFERKQIKNSPSFLDGIDLNTENRYRREGARFIIDAGTKMGLRCDTCATGVVFFHRFYMFHSFKEFYRYVTAACCLFLAGKVEETPKKCKDIIKVAQTLLSSASFSKFGDDPREEVMTMERMLLKTIKFDFQIEHPYAHLLRYAKLFKCEKEKVQNMAQMAWTFINDSMCTTLSLQWEPEIVCVSLMYLASRLTKFEPGDWQGKSSSKSKWWEDWLEGMSMELMEDICHQVLDLYSNKNKKGVPVDSPPCSPAKSIKADSTPPPPPERPPPAKKSREEVKPEPEPIPKVEPKEKEVKPTAVAKPEKESSAVPAPAATEDNTPLTGAPIPVAQHRTPSYRGNNSYKPSGDADGYSTFNPYVSSRMYSSSFMSQEGSRNIQSILAGQTAPQSSVPPVYPDQSHNPPHSHLAAQDSSMYPQTTSQYAYIPPPSSQYAHSSIPAPHVYQPPANQAPAYDPYNPTTNPSYLPPSTYNTPPPSSVGASHHSYLPPSHLPPSHHAPYPPSQYPSQSIPPQRPVPGYHPPPSHSYPRSGEIPPQYGAGSRNYSNANNKKDIPALTDINLSGRYEWNNGTR